MKSLFYGIFGSLIMLSFQACKSNDKTEIENYAEDFRENESIYNTLVNHLILKYCQDGKYKNQTRVVLYNPSKTKKSLPHEIADTSIQNWLDKADILTIHLENEDSLCSNGMNFDKIYFEINRNSYYPIVNYIYSVCAFDPINYKSQTIIRKTVKPHWDILIDNSFP